jgi:hypothetical protein
MQQDSRDLVFLDTTDWKVLRPVLPYPRLVVCLGVSIVYLLVFRLLSHIIY